MIYKYYSSIISGETKNKEKIQKHHETSTPKKRLTVLTYYSFGNLKCSCCDESEYDFLTIDHIENNGNEHRRVIGNNLYNWLIQHNFPEGFDVLCMNCNHGKSKHNGVCPHNIGKFHSVR